MRIADRRGQRTEWRRGAAARNGERGVRVVPFLLALAAMGLASGACGRIREVADRLLDDRTARERYIARLEGAGLANTALARDWMTAAQRVLETAPLVATPHTEQGYLPPAEPAAIGFRVNLRRGQEVAFEVRLPGDSSTLVFLDAWQFEGDAEAVPRRVAEADSGARALTFEPRRDGEVVFRAQPELLRGGRFAVTLRVGPTLAFPVQDRRERDIGSRFGAPRDAGVRSHHGIDIFAPRGTPAIAAAEATVSRVETTPIGGNVVWLRDRRGNSLYYAHLDRQLVTPGARVVAGDTVGFVGNTGNARSTPPHLHFGVYRRGEGPMDPYWFVHRPQALVVRLSADTAVLGEWMRVSVNRAIVRREPDAEADTVVAVGRHGALRVLTAVGAWYGVRLPDGVTGYVRTGSMEIARRPIRTTSLTLASQLQSRPVRAAPVDGIIQSIQPGTQVEVLAHFSGFALVRAGGVAGWISQ